VDRDLHKFKDFIEHREAETGAWRGSVKPTGGVVADRVPLLESLGLRRANAGYRPSGLRMSSIARGVKTR
jgi:hypothetical protein